MGLIFQINAFADAPAIAQNSTTSKDLNDQAKSLLTQYKAAPWSRAYELFIDEARLYKDLRDRNAYFTTLIQASRVKTALGEPNAALTLLTDDGWLDENTLLPRVRSELLSEASRVALQLGKFELSRKYYLEAISLGNQSGEPRTIGEAYFSAGEYLYQRQQIDEMIAAYLMALEKFRLAGDKERESDTLVELCYARMLRREFFAGLAYAETAHAISKETADQRGEANALIAIGNASISMGESKIALDAYKTADKIIPTDLDQTRKGKIANGLGALYEKIGDWNRSLQYRRNALTLYQKEGNIGGQLYTLISAGRLANLIRDEQSADVYLADAEKIALDAGDDFARAQVWLERGTAKLSTGDRSARIPLEQALKVFAKLEDKFYLAITLSKIGYVEQLLNDLDSSEKSFRAALKYNREIKNRFAESDSLFHLARLHSNQKDNEKTLALIEQSIAITETLRGGLVNDKLRTSFFSTIYERYELFIHALMKKRSENSGKDYVKTAFQAAEGSRARSMLENLVLSESRFYADADPALVLREKATIVELNSKSDKVTELLGRNANKLEIDKFQSEINELQIQLEDIKAELKQNSPIYSSIKNPEPFDVGDFQKNVLGEDDLLLEFSLGKDESYLWAVDKADVTAYYLPPREQIEARVDKLRSLLGARRLKQGELLEEYQRRLADAELEYKAEARILSSQLLGQAKEKLAGKKLIIVADGRLHYFPLGSLPMPGTNDDAPVLLTNEVVYAPSASTLKILRMKKNTETRPQKDLLVFADPVFSKSDERIAGLDTSNNGFVSMIMPMFRSIESLESMPRLPASEDEARSISEVVGANQTTVRAGFAANRDGVLNGGIEDYKILHFATHGLIDEKRPELSGILLSLYTDEGKQNDGGFIRLQDVYGLRLNSDLVVLSACDTGIGKEIKGEGVMSLNNAFLQAGAKSVVSSLWKVDDTATKDLMTEFYRGMADDGLTAAAALRQAQIKMYNDPRYRSPFYWAAFTASGDTAVKVAFTSYAWLYAAIATAVLAAAMLTFLALRRYRHRYVAASDKQNSVG